MNRKGGGGKPWTRDFQSRQQAPNQKRADGVQQHIHGVVSRGMIAPRQPLQPQRERGECKIRLEPNRQRRQFSGGERIIFLDETGFVFPVQIPWLSAGIVIGATLLVATLAGLLPALRAAQLRITEAIAYE